MKLINKETKLFIIKNVVAAITLIIIWIVLEPFVYAYTGVGFMWDYNPDYTPFIYR